MPAGEVINPCKKRILRVYTIVLNNMTIEEKKDDTASKRSDSNA
jgi:hypothetical protein